MSESGDSGLAAAGDRGGPLFAAQFGREPLVEASAPGRVNLIGEHTDYNEGLVLPCAIDLETRVWAAPRADRCVRVFAGDLEEMAEFEIDRLGTRGDWLDYVQGVVWALQQSRGVGPSGFDLALSSRLPIGAGLSSSAALELALIGAIDALQAFGLDAAARADLAQRAERDFVGVPCGPMDQRASAFGRAGHALRIDCRDASLRPIALADASLALLIVHSGVSRSLAQGVYEERVRECRLAFEGALEAGVAAPGARALRDLRSGQLPELARVLDERLLRRARHVITENERVEQFCVALEGDDRASLGRLLHEGQQSLALDYEVSSPELDLLCEIGERTPGVVGSRLTGAGLGGCTLHLVESDRAIAAAERIAEGFASRFGKLPRYWLTRAAGGARARRLDPL